MCNMPRQRIAAGGSRLLFVLCLEEKIEGGSSEHCGTFYNGSLVKGDTLKFWNWRSLGLLILSTYIS